uniref:Kinase suppressor of ras 1 n=1 Tax=Amphilophus citrinellus TaxID=61819 RepID=A0A3Q0RVG2_AMPCI
KASLNSRASALGHCPTHTAPDPYAGAEEALHQCRLIQNLVDISISSLLSLRTRCAASNDLTRQEIRTLEVKLTKYMWKQLQLRQRVPEGERPEALAQYPRLEDWLLTADLTPQFIQAAAGKLSVDSLLQMSSSELQDTMRRLSSSSEDRSRLTAALSCLKSANETGDQKTSNSSPFSPISPPSSSGSPFTPLNPSSSHGRSISISVVPCSDDQRPSVPVEDMSDAFSLEPSTPPATRVAKARTSKPSYTPPPPSRKLLQFLPNIALTKSKSHESQLANRIEDPGTHKVEYVPQLSSYSLSVLCRFSTKSWLSQTCQVCCRSMMFGVKCKHCKLKCHNKCTKDAPSCRISFPTLPRMRRAESVPSDINNRIDHTAEISLQFGTLPKAVTKRPVPSITQLDSSSNPSSATSSTPSSPAHFQQSNPPSVSATPPPNPSPQGFRDNRFNFPDYPGVDEEAANKTDGKKSCSSEEHDEDGLDDLPLSICRREAAGRSGVPISRKVSQTSVYLQEWDIPYEQLQLGELIGKGRWGKVHKGRWHGEVAIRLLEIDGNNQDHLKVFKKEVMNYRQTRHENVVLFMGACMAPPHLAIITRYSCMILT